MGASSRVAVLLCQAEINDKQLVAVAANAHQEVVLNTKNIYTECRGTYRLDVAVNKILDVPETN
jgi:hypothetical protein